MTQIFSANPFRCRVWNLHVRHEHLIDEETCRTEIQSFSDHGQLVAVLGRQLRGDPDYDIELIYGARRLFIARHLNVLLRVELRDMTDRTAVIAMDIENRQRRDVSPYERGMSFARALRAGCFESQDELARSLNISQSQISRLLALSRLPTAIVSAFPSTMEIRESWGPSLVGLLEDPRKRTTTIARARVLSSRLPRPSAIDVYQQLIAASVPGRKIRLRTHDEVVTDIDGTPLFRIRHQERTIAVLLPRERISEETLCAIREAVRRVLRQRRRPAVILKHVPIKAPYDSSTGSSESSIAGAGSN